MSHAAVCFTVRPRLRNVKNEAAVVYSDASAAIYWVDTEVNLVNGKFRRLVPNELWVTDFAEHPSKERQRSRHNENDCVI
jgi:hypothetical protein